MLKRLKRLWCNRRGHVWGEPVAVQYAIPDMLIYHTHCDRCSIQVIGNWDAMENLGAFRTSLYRRKP